MKAVLLIIISLILFAIIFIAIGDIQKEFSYNYDVTHNPDDFEFDNSTAQIEDLSNEIKTDITESKISSASLTDKASAILGATMNTGKLVLSLPNILNTFLYSLESKIGLPISGISSLISLAFLVLIVFSVLFWRRSGI